MASRIVAHLTLAVFAAALTVPVGAQQAGDFTTPRPRQGLAPGHLGLAAPQADEPPKLGVMVSDSDDGVVVSDVFDDSLAESAGVQAGDILFRIAGARIDAVTDIPAALAARTEPGGDVTITVIREGEGLVTLHGTRAAPEPPKPAEPGGSWVGDDSRGAFLGVQLGEGTEDGVLIAGVIDDSAAWFVGLEEGDVLTRVGETRCRTGEQVAAAVAALHPGELVELRWERGDSVTERMVRLGRRLPENPLGMMFGPGGLQLEGLPALRDMRIGPRIGRGPGAHGGMRFMIDDGELIELHEALRDAHEALEWTQDIPDAQGAQNMRIEIKDGTMTIDRDGEVEVIDLDEHGHVDGASLVLPGVLGAHASQGPAPDGIAYGIRIGQVSSPASGAPSCTGAASEVSCDAQTECEVAVECEVECEDEAGSDDDLL